MDNSLFQKLEEGPSGAGTAFQKTSPYRVDTELYSKTLLTEGHFEVEYWHKAKSITVPFELKMELGTERLSATEQYERFKKKYE